MKKPRKGPSILECEFKRFNALYSFKTEKTRWAMFWIVHKEPRAVFAQTTGPFLFVQTGDVDEGMELEGSWFLPNYAIRFCSETLSIEMIPMSCLLRKKVCFAFRTREMGERWYNHLYRIRQFADQCDCEIEIPMKVREFDPMTGKEVPQEWLVTEGGFGPGREHKADWFEFVPEVRICTACEIEQLPMETRIRTCVVDSMGKAGRKIIITENVEDMITLFFIIWIHDQKVKRAINCTEDAMAEEDCFPMEVFYEPKPVFASVGCPGTDRKCDCLKVHECSFSESLCCVPRKASTELEIVELTNGTSRTVIVGPVIQAEGRTVRETSISVGETSFNVEDVLPKIKTQPISITVGTVEDGFAFQAPEDNDFFGQDGSALQQSTLFRELGVSHRIEKLPFREKVVVQPPVIERIRNIGNSLSDEAVCASHEFGELCSLLAGVLSHEANPSLLAHLQAAVAKDPGLRSCFPAPGKYALVIFVFRLLIKRKFARLIRTIIAHETCRREIYSGASVMDSDMFVQELLDALPDFASTVGTIVPSTISPFSKFVPRYDRKIERACTELNLLLLWRADEGMRKAKVMEVSEYVVEFLRYRLLVQHSMTSILETVIDTMKDCVYVTELSEVYNSKHLSLSTEEKLKQVVAAGVLTRHASFWVAYFAEVALAKSTHASGALIYVRECLNLVCMALDDIRTSCL